MNKDKKKPLPDYILRRVPRHLWNTLHPVPTWEGVLYYDTLDFALNRPLTFYRRLFCWQLDEEIIYPMRVYQTNTQAGSIKRGSNRKPMYRRFIKFTWQPNLLLGKCRCKVLYCHQLTMLCWMGFAIYDRRHWVVDHIDSNPLNDRPKNLQVISQSENLRRSEKIMKNAAELFRGKSNAQRHAEAVARREEREKNEKLKIEKLKR